MKRLFISCVVICALVLFFGNCKKKEVEVEPKGGTHT